MKNRFIGLSILSVAALGLFSCNKQPAQADSVSLSASATSVAVGQTVTITASTSANTLSWTVTPANTLSKLYAVTTEKVNYLSFSQAGNYLVGVRARNLPLDSIHHCNPSDSLHVHQDSTWNRHIDSLWVLKGFHHGGCKDGLDSASIRITVQ